MSCSYILTKQQYSASPALPSFNNGSYQFDLLGKLCEIQYHNRYWTRGAGTQRYKYVLMNSNSWFTPSVHISFAVIVAIIGRIKE
jgi:hypothetical protein